MAIPQHPHLVDGVRYALLALGLSGLAWLWAAAAPRAAGETVVSAGDPCRYVVAHRPGADVAYQPGRGARGESVTPADLPGAGLALAPSAVAIDLNLALRDVASGGQVARVGDSDVRIGTIGFESGGERLDYNGQPMADPAAHAAAEACRAARADR